MFCEAAPDLEKNTSPRFIALIDPQEIIRVAPGEEVVFKAQTVVI